MDLSKLESMTHFAHSRMVSRISGLLARKAGFSPAEAGTIEQAALYHDIGKAFLSADILCKRGALTPEEYAVVYDQNQIIEQKSEKP